MIENKINVTYIIDKIGWAGAQTHLISVLRNINYDDFNVSVVCLRSAGVQFSILESLPVKSLVLNLENLMTPLKTLSAIVKLKQFLNENNTDILHSYMFNPNLMACLVAMIPWKRFKLITTRRDTGYWHQKHHWTLYKFMNIVTNKVIAVSSEVRLVSIENENISPNKIITIFNGLDLNVFNAKNVNRNTERRRFSLDDDDFVIGILAAIRPEKRHDLLIEAAVKVVKSIPKVKFMIVGDGYQKTKDDINTLISSYKLENRFILTGKLSNVVPALAAFDVSILCSDSEGMSNTVLQSIAMGKATIVTDVGGNPEVIQDKNNGLVIPPNDADALANAILNLYESKSTKEKIENNAEKSAIERFNIVPIIESLQAVYHDMIKV